MLADETKHTLGNGEQKIWLSRLMPYDLVSLQCIEHYIYHSGASTDLRNEVTFKVAGGRLVHRLGRVYSSNASLTYLVCKIFHHNKYT